MARWIQCFILMVGLLPLASHAEESDAKPGIDSGESPLLDPRIERRRVKEADIDSENFEVAVFAGIYSSDGFGTNSSYTLRLAYHVSEDVFVEGGFGKTELGETSFEKLTPGVSLLTDEQREVSWYNVSLGYNILPGEAFLGGGRAYNNALYLLAGAGNTDFADDDRFTINVGVGYRVLLSDWLALRTEVRSHLFDQDVLGQVETSHNLDWSLGLSAFF